jgi:hypothetical protein
MDQSHSSVTITVDNSDPREPTARCERCGKLGTVARATRHSEPPLVLRYCADCWPAAQSELEARQNEEHKQWRLSPARNTSPAPGWSSTSRSWHDVVRFLRLIASPPSDGRAPTQQELRSIASEINATANEMSGAMPSEVRAFLDKYAPPAA